jgi:hypothetical protein
VLYFKWCLTDCHSLKVNIISFSPVISLPMLLKMITIKTFINAIEANIIKGRLESEGIPTLLLDENTVNTYWLYANAIGGMRLQVKEEHVQQALNILKEDSAKMYLINDDEEDKTSCSCPNCFSSNVGLNKYSKKAFGFSWLLIGFPLLIPDKKFYCFNCGNEWKQ